MATVRIRVQGYVEGAEGGPQELVDNQIRFATTAALGRGDRRQYSIATTVFSGFTIPAGTRYCMIEIPAGAESLFLKNVIGDTTGIALTDATAASVPKMTAVIPVDGTSPALGVLNSGASTQVLTVTML